MVFDAATDGREAAFRNTRVTYIYPGDALVEEAFEGIATVETHLIIKLTGPLAGWKPLDMGSGLDEPSIDLALQHPDGTALDVYIKFIKSNKLLGTQRRYSQPATHPADTISTIKSARVHTDGGSL